ncbi:MAG TPA: DNA cytosine methyltransferase [Zeimonas sp.]|nr:DNA cytosine methyltransferase [Zeimonas sp.]
MALAKGQTQTTSNKPSYRVPSMAEIAEIPWNGYRVVSTFSGAGGSCLGFRMAGYRVVWASEFVPAAQETYRANHPDTILDTRDIRQVTAEDILSATGLAVGELDVFEGSPPCASFSTAGKREAGWGKVKAYSDTKQRVDDLFFEYARLLRDLQPRVFVAENVSGLVKGTAKGYFKEILRELRACGYVVEARLLDAQWLGVPQTRQRLIFQGVREDLGCRPAWPEPLPYRYSVRDALPWIRAVQHSRGWKPSDEPCPTIVQTGALLSPTARFSGGTYVEAETDISRFAIGAEWEKLKPGEKSERYFNLVRVHPDRPSPTITQTGGEPSAAGPTHPYERRKFTIGELKRICAFPDDFLLTGTYEQQWERLGRAVPPVMMYHVARVIRDEILGRLP